MSEQAIVTSPGGGVNLGSAFGSIVIDDNIDAALRNATRSFDNALSQIGGQMQRIGSTMSNIGSQITVATAPIALAMGQGIRTASSYEDALKEIEVRAGLTADELAMVVEKTKEIGQESQYGPTQAADAFLQLLSSGSSVEEAMIQVDAVIQGASASGQELGFVADALTDVMAGFGLEAEHSQRVMQALISATASSSATFPDLVAGFSNVGPAARNAGLTIEETAAALAVFAENGIKGAEGGTQLKTVLTQLQSDRAAVELERLGVSISDVEGNIRPLNEIIQDLNVSMDGMTEVERNQAIMELVGSYGQLGLSALLASGGIDDMEAAMANGADIADVAASRLDTFSGQMSYLKGSVELLMIEALMPLMQDALRPMVESIAEVVNKVREWIVENPELAQQIVRVLAVLTTVGPTLVVAGRALSLVGSLISGLGGAIGFLLSPIGLVTVALGAMAAAFAMDFGGIRTAFEESGIEGIKEKIEGIDWDEVVNNAFDAIGTAIDTAVDMLTWVYDNILKPIWESLSAKVAEIDWGIFVTDVFNAIGTAVGIAVDILSWAYENIVRPLFEALIQKLGEVDWDQVGSGIMNAIETALATVVDIAVWAYENLIKPLFDGLMEKLGEVDWGQVGTDILNAIGAALGAVFDFVGWVYDNILEPILMKAAIAIEETDWFAVGESVVNAIGTALQTAFDFVTWLVNAIFNPMANEGEEGVANSDVADLGEFIMNAIGTFLSGVFNFVKWVGDTIIGPFIDGAISAIGQTDWGSIGQGLLDAIGNAIPNIGNWVTTNIINPIRNALSGFDPVSGISGVDTALGIINGTPQPWTGTPKGFAVGTNYLPMDMLIMAHEGEAIIPAANNPYNPAASKPSGLEGGGIQVNINNITANSREEGAMAGEAFGDAFIMKLRENGYNG